LGGLNHLKLFLGKPRFTIFGKNLLGQNPGALFFITHIQFEYVSCSEYSAPEGEDPKAEIVSYGQMSKKSEYPSDDLPN